MAMERDWVVDDLPVLLEGGRPEVVDGWFWVTFRIEDWGKVLRLEAHRGALRRVGRLVGCLEEVSGMNRFEVRVEDGDGIWPVMKCWLAEKYSDSTLESRYRSDAPHAMEVMKDPPGKFTSRKLSRLYHGKLWRACTGKRKKQMQGFDTHDRKWKNIRMEDAIEILAYRPWLTGLVRIQPDHGEYEDYPR